ncbi:MAG: glycosyltransferase family 39 protein [Phycisphaerales bacterium]
MTRARRTLLLWLLPTLASLALWPVLRHALLTRDLSFQFIPVSGLAADASLEWSTPRGPQGIWLSPLPTGPSRIEFHPSGHRDSGDGPMQFHIYRISAGDWSLSREDLKRDLVRTQNGEPTGWSLSGSWAPGAPTSGIIFTGTAPGALSIPLPPQASLDSVVIDSERTRDGGPITIDRDGAITTLSCASPGPWQPLTIFPRAPFPPTAHDIRQCLPADASGFLSLRWHSLAAANDAPSFETTPAVLRTRLLGVTLSTATLRGPLEVTGGEFEVAPRARIRCRMPSGDARWELPPLPPLFHALGVTLLFLTSLAAIRLSRLAIAAARAAHALIHAGPRPSPASHAAFWPVRVALTLVALAHLWLASWAPMLFLPDAVDYAHNAQRLVDTVSFAHFNAWRLPGLSLILTPFTALAGHPEEFFGWVQAAMGVTAAWLAHRTLLPFAGPRWSILAMLLVGLHPAVLAWERHLITETPTLFLVTLAWWLASILPAASPRRRLLLSLTLGIAAALAILTRANTIPVFLLLLPAIWLAMRAVSSPRAASTTTALALAAALACLTPWVLRNRAVFGEPAIIIGRGYARLIFAWHAGLHDLNQTALYNREGWQFALLRRAQGNHEFDYFDQLDASPRLASPLHPWVARDKRCAAAATESRLRAGPESGVLALRAILSHLHLYSHPAHPQFRNNDYYHKPLRGILYSTTTPTSWGRDPRWRPDEFHLPTLDVIAGRTVRDISFVTTSPHARTFARADALARWLWPVFGALFLLGGAVSLARRDWLIAAAAAAFLANALAFSWVFLCGETRYSDPLLPLYFIVAVYALRAICAPARYTPPAG